MTVYSNLYKLTTNPYFNYEYEVLNELKDLSERTDSNCLFHTRFCFEMDNDSLDSQIAIIKKIQDNLVRVVYSGSKSYHCIIEFAPEFEEQCKNYYKEIWHYLNEKLFCGKCDRQCANPSRLTRAPGVIRKDKEKLQELIYNNPRNYFNGTVVIAEVAKKAELKQLSYQINRSLNAQQTHFTDNSGYDPNGKCFNYDKIQHYLNTPYPKLKGNGDSSISLFSALATCIKYHDNQTKELILNKARSEHWTEKELNRMIQNINKI